MGMHSSKKKKNHGYAFKPLLDAYCGICAFRYSASAFTVFLIFIYEKRQAILVPLGPLTINKFLKIHHKADYDSSKKVEV